MTTDINSMTDEELEQIYNECPRDSSWGKLPQEKKDFFNGVSKEMGRRHDEIHKAKMKELGVQLEMDFDYEDGSMTYYCPLPDGWTDNGDAIVKEGIEAALPSAYFKSRCYRRIWKNIPAVFGEDVKIRFCAFYGTVYEYDDPDAKTLERIGTWKELGGIDGPVPDEGEPEQIEPGYGPGWRYDDGEEPHE
jgi:hypothetical protein